MREAFVKKREAFINYGKHMKRSNKIYKREALINYQRCDFNINYQGSGQHLNDSFINLGNKYLYLCTNMPKCDIYKKFLGKFCYIFHINQENMNFVNENLRCDSTFDGNIMITNENLFNLLNFKNCIKYFNIINDFKYSCNSIVQYNNKNKTH